MLPLATTLFLLSFSANIYIEGIPITSGGRLQRTICLNTEMCRVCKCSLIIKYTPLCLACMTCTFKCEAGTHVTQSAPSTTTQSPTTVSTTTDRPTTQRRTTSTTAKQTLYPTPAILQLEGCNDQLTNCYAYGKDICTTFQTWAGRNCALSCGFCQTTPNPTQPVSFHWESVPLESGA